MTDLREIVDVRGPGLPSEFVCETTVGSDLLAACGLGEEEVLLCAAPAPPPASTASCSRSAATRWRGRGWPATRRRAWS